MNITELLHIISELAKQNGLAQPYIIGGVSRDRILGRIKEKTAIKDIDLTTGNKDAAKLGVLVAKRFPEGTYNTFDDGHSSVDIFGLHLDFSSNFIIPGIDQELNRLGIKHIDDMKREIHSRDFTMNTILETLDFSSTYDLTKEGIGDIHAGLIRCPIDPNITIGIDARRILRAIKFAIKFDFVIEHELKNAMRRHRKLIQNLPPNFVRSKIDEIVQLDAVKGLDMLIEYKILPLVQPSKMVYDLLIQHRKLLGAL